MTLDPKLGSSILASVEQGFADQVSFTQELMRFASLRGEEHAVQDFVFRALRDRGYAVERFEMDRAALERHPGAGAFSAQHSRAPIVVGIHRPRQERGRSLGVLWFQVQVRGVPVHVREMGEGANAIDAAYRLIGELRRLEAEWNAAKSGREHFEREEHPINLNIGRIEGGDWASSVPAWCTLHYRISIYPGQSAEAAARELEKCISNFARNDRFLANLPPSVTFNGFRAEGYTLEPGSEAEKVLGRAHRAATGADLQSFMTAGYLDTRVHALYDKIPALCYGPCSQGIHAFDERVSLASVKRITGTIALFVAEWCGTER